MEFGVGAAGKRKAAQDNGRHNIEVEAAADGRIGNAGAHHGEQCTHGQGKANGRIGQEDAALHANAADPRCGGIAADALEGLSKAGKVKEVIARCDEYDQGDNLGRCSVYPGRLAVGEHDAPLVGHHRHHNALANVHHAHGRDKRRNLQVIADKGRDAHAHNGDDRASQKAPQKRNARIERHSDDQRRKRHHRADGHVQAAHGVEERAAHHHHAHGEALVNQQAQVFHAQKLAHGQHLEEDHQQHHAGKGQQQRDPLFLVGLAVQRQLDLVLRLNRSARFLLGLHHSFCPLDIRFQILLITRPYTR